MPESPSMRNLKNQMIFVNMTSVGGQMPTSEALIDNMMSCFKAYPNREYAPQIIFFINYEGNNFVINGDNNMGFADYLKEISKFLK